MRISDWSSDVCSSDLLPYGGRYRSNAILLLAWQGRRCALRSCGFQQGACRVGDQAVKKSEVTAVTLTTEQSGRHRVAGILLTLIGLVAFPFATIFFHVGQKIGRAHV